MKVGFDLGSTVRTKKAPYHVGQLVAKPGPLEPGHKFPHYSGDGWYFVKWDARTEVYVCHEDDIELAPSGYRPLYKTTIVIWSEQEPGDEDIEQLARDAMRGDRYCSVEKTQKIDRPCSDPDWDGTEFFDDPAEDEEE